MKSKDYIPEVFSSLRKVFENVETEVIQNNQDLMECMIRVCAYDNQKNINYELLSLNFKAELEWENDEDETPVCNVSEVYIPLDLTQKGKERYDQLIKAMTGEHPEWLKGAEVKVEWHEPYEYKAQYYCPMIIRLRNVNTEMAARFISFIASHFLPKGNDMGIWTKFTLECEEGSTWVEEFIPDEDERVTLTKPLY